MVVVEEGSGATSADTDWLESEEFEAMPSDPIFMSADKFTKSHPSGTLSRVCLKKEKKKHLSILL